MDLLIEKNAPISREFHHFRVSAVALFGLQGPDLVLIKA